MIRSANNLDQFNDDNEGVRIQLTFINLIRIDGKFVNFIFARRTAKTLLDLETEDFER